MTFSGFIKAVFVCGWLLSVAALGASSVPGSVTVNSVGRELGDAMVAAVRAAVSQNFRSYPGYSKQVLDEEIIPAASQLVSSYKVLEGSDGSSHVNISAVVELSLVRNMLDFGPKSLGVAEEEEGKAALVFRAPPISFLDRNKVTGYYDELRTMLKDRLERRKFKVQEVSEDIKETAALGDDVSEPGVLRIYGVENEADLALGVQILPDTDGRGGWDLKGTLLLVKSGKTLGQFTQAIPSPRYKKETFQAELQRSLADAGNQMMMAVLSRAGGIAGTPSRREDFLHLKIVNLKNAILLEKFRQSAIALPEIQSLAEFSVKRGSYELAVNTRLNLKQLEAKLKSLTWEDMDAEFSRGEGLELVVRLIPKTVEKKEGQEDAKK